MAAGSTYTPIATFSSSGSSNLITFSSISSAYTDLQLVMQLLPTASQNFITRVGNGTADSGSNYSGTFLYGNGTSPASGRVTSQTSILGGWGNNTGNSTNILQFMNYSNTTTYKTTLLRLNNAGDVVTAAVDTWRNTAAINIITIATSTGNFASGSTFTLYGIAAA
jgi:hypothetical protein